MRVGGWVKTGRIAGGGDFAFLEVNDGSTFANLQVCLICHSFLFAVVFTGSVSNYTSAAGPSCHGMRCQGAVGRSRAVLQNVARQRGQTDLHPPHQHAPAARMHGCAVSVAASGGAPEI